MAQTRVRTQAPPGYEIAERDGRYTVRKRKGPPTNRTISFRYATEDYLRLGPFRESFESGEWSEAMRWLLAHPAVRAVMMEKILADQPQRRKR